MPYIEINDIFDELRDEDKRIFNELQFANNLIDIYSEFKSFIDSNINTFNTDSNTLNKYQELCLKIELKRKTHKIISGSDDSDKYFIDSIGYTVSDQLNDNSLELDINVNQIKTSGKTLVDTKRVNTKKRVDKKRFDLKTVDTKKVQTKRVNTKRVRPKSQFLCPFNGCDNKYNTKLQLQEHTQTEHLPIVPESEVDSECDETNQRSKLKKHVCQYSGCKYKTNKIRCLRKHVEKHIRPRVFQYLCKNCKIRFKSDDKWRLHMNSVHNNDRPYVCDHIGCQLAYRSSNYLRLHKISHNEKDLHRCTEPGCDRKFKSKEYLKKHVLYVHSQPDRMKCEWPGCEFNTGDPRHMNRHKRVHIQERPFVCDVDQCGKAFMDKLQLTRHKNVVHRLGTVFECYWPGCEYSTGDKISMRTHESIHKTGGGEYVCSWPECGKRMAHKQSLEDHINAIHKNVKPFSCPVAGCPYRTAFRRNIRQHSKTHRDKASKKSIPNDSKS